MLDSCPFGEFVGLVWCSACSHDVGVKRQNRVHVGVAKIGVLVRVGLYFGGSGRLALVRRSCVICDVCSASINCQGSKYYKKSHDSPPKHFAI